MRHRPSSRLILLDPSGRVLLFRFSFTKGSLIGQSYWATPGGAVEDGETFEQAAIRELEEETGLVVETVGGEISRREFKFQLPNGEYVIADEHFFMVQTAERKISDKQWSVHEKDVMVAHHWWSRDELAQTSETIFPENLLELIQAI